jgi:hypothetical protein
MDLVDGGFLSSHLAGRVPTSGLIGITLTDPGRARSPADQTLISDTLQGTVDVQSS